MVAMGSQRIGPVREHSGGRRPGQALGRGQETPPNKTRAPTATKLATVGNSRGPSKANFHQPGLALSDFAGRIVETAHHSPEEPCNPAAQRGFNSSLIQS